MQLKTTFSLVLALALMSGSGALLAQEMSKSGKPLTAQQSKMKACNAEATTKSLKGPERKTFMSTCLKADSGAAAPTQAAAAPMSAKETQQQKMKTCNAEAKTESLKGAARKAFMKTCLSGEAAAAH